MKAAPARQAHEPVGIVISVSSTAEEPTVFSAYVWGPAPGTDTSPPKAA